MTLADLELTWDRCPLSSVAVNLLRRPGTQMTVQIVPLEPSQKHYLIPVSVGTLGLLEVTLSFSLSRGWPPSSPQYSLEVSQFFSCHKDTHDSLSVGVCTQLQVTQKACGGNASPRR